MLQLTNVRKTYKTAGFEQVALDDVSIGFRDNEFVAILGPSGSGKTTLLNIIGGLDHYDSGDLVIDGISTVKYKDRDWDTYRNNRIGFVFQSYNLIPHQTVLTNVELALTLSGVSRSERRARAIQALEEVGLGDHIYKKPNQLSGGQMQRVAVARALINDPEILLADEPTGALDSKTSVQIMELLTQIARDRLVIMVTHNPELAERYANRTVSLSDGRVETDTNPYVSSTMAALSAKPVRKSNMGFFTALSLSFSNLMTKKGRTLMTAFAGSIGIIGIAAILALANGVNHYIKTVEEDTLSVYPLSITSTGMDLTSMLAMSSASDNDPDDTGANDENDEKQTDGDSDSSLSVRQAEDGTVREFGMLSNMFSRVGSNDLAALKTYLEKPESGIDPYVNAIEYTYSVTPQIYLPDTSDKVRQVNPDSTFKALGVNSFGSSSSSLASLGMSSGLFRQLMEDTTIAESQYDVLAGHWPESYDELVLVTSKNGAISDYAFYLMGLRDMGELEQMVDALANDEEIIVPDSKLKATYEDILGVQLSLVYPTDYYGYDETYGVWTNKSDDEEYVRQLVEKGETLKIVGIVSTSPEAGASSLNPGIYYRADLVRHIIDHSASTQIVKDQLADPTINVFTGKRFTDEARDGSSNAFDLEDMITVDEDAIAKAFNVDASAFDLDLSSAFSPDAMAAAMPAMPTLDFSQAIAQISLADLPIQDLTAFLVEAMSDYLAYSLEEGTTQETIDKVLSGFLAYVDREDIQQQIQLGLTGLIDMDRISAVMTQTFTDYLETMDPSATPQEIADGFAEYLQRPEVLAQLKTDLDGAYDQEGITSLVAALLSDYINFEMEQGELQQMISGHLSAWISSPDVQSHLMQRFEEVVGTNRLLAPIQTALQGYLQQMMQGYLLQLMTTLQAQIAGGMASAMGQLSSTMATAMSFDQESFAKAFNFNMDEEELKQLMMAMMGNEQSSFDNNIKKLGYADLDKPSRIDIYPIDFESKQDVLDILDAYNARMEESGNDERVITYTDIVGVLMTSVTDIINMISYVLVAFVSISLVVSSIMIGVITYISVLERKKEIGILRSIGASKRDIGSVFNAETLIVGLVAGIMGIGITLLLTVPANAIVLANFDIANIAILPWEPAVLLILISMVLTFVAGLIPSSAASRKDPVEALRSE
ncbi:MAG: ABC transporter ATP-binding protein/permease [Coriobacteriaceae bacterium]|nr:ABC transporter ATP-binding protein/permease [Coriobacteriaceae bacterium]